MLQPKRTKFRKMQKGRMKGNAQRGSQIAFGSFAIKSMEECWMTARQIEAASEYQKILEQNAKSQEKVCSLSSNDTLQTPVKTATDFSL